jgi:hypothetical protein
MTASENYNYKRNFEGSEQLLVDRRRVVRMLGCSKSTVIRLEKAGILPRVRLNSKANCAKAYYRLGDVMDLIQSGTQAG